MKTKNIFLLFSIVITFISLPIQAAVHAIDQTQPILLSTGYGNSMNEEWDVTSTVTNQPLKITYSISTESGCDLVTIYNVDNSGNATTLITLSGIQSGSITTLIPNGKAKIVFTSDGSVCYPTYSGLNISLAADNPLVVSSNINASGNAYINGYLGVGTSSVTKKFEVWDGKAGKFTFSATGCTLGYEIAQTIDDTGYKLNVGSTVRNYKVATNGADRLTITNIGNVGIGEVNPQGALQVRGTYDNSWIYFSSNAGMNSTKYKPKVNYGLAFTWNYSGGDGESIINYAASSATSRLDFTSFDGTNLTTEMTLKKGCLGIGTITPQAPLHIKASTLNGSFRISPSTDNTESSMGFFSDAAGTSTATAWVIGNSCWGNTGKFIIGNQAAGGSIIAVQQNGNVGIGIGNANAVYKLEVKGTIHANEVIVDVNGAIADYVFKPSYKLMPLSQVEQYVTRNSHLPEIPSADEIMKKGMSMGEMQNKLLQKVEELTLYMIDQQKTINQQSAKIEELEKRLK